MEDLSDEDLSDATEERAIAEFAERAAGWLSHPDADRSIRLLNFVHYAERLLPWAIGLRGDAAERAPEAVRRQLPTYAFCLASMLDSKDVAV